MNNSKQITLTIDDLPFEPTLKSEEGTEVTNQLLLHLQQTEVKATCFVVGSWTYEAKDGIERFKLLEKWHSDGHLLANHTYSHLPLSQMSSDDFEHDIIENEKILAPFQGKYSYFRFPFLDYGCTSEQKNRARNFLYNRSYSIVPVSIDAKDYIYNAIYSIEDAEIQQQIIDRYLEYTKKIAKFREQQSIRFFGRIFGQILLIHANRINASCLDKIIVSLKRQGYEFVSLQETLNDPVYESGIAKINAKKYLSWDRFSYPEIDTQELEVYKNNRKYII